jgi:hypothetical protein
MSYNLRFFLLTNIFDTPLFQRISDLRVIRIIVIFQNSLVPIENGAVWIPKYQSFILLTYFFEIRRLSGKFAHYLMPGG